MNQSSGFVPIKYRLAGKLFLIAGIIGLFLTVLAYATRWYTLPSTVPILSTFAIILSLYLIKVVPDEWKESSE